MSRIYEHFHKYSHTYFNIFYSLVAVIALYFLLFENLQYPYVFLLISVCLTYFFLIQSSKRKNPVFNVALENALAIFFSLTFVTGIYFDKGIPFERLDPVDGLIMLLYILSLTPLFRSILRLILFGILYISQHTLTNNDHSDHSFDLPFCCISAIVILFSWGIVYLAYYPGLWNYDPHQVYQVINEEYNKQHPLLHTLILGNCYKYGVSIHSPKVGLRIYYAIQMSILATSCILTCEWIKRHTKNLTLPIITLLFYAFVPINSILALSTTKDVMFSAFSSLSLLMLLCIIHSDNRKMTRLYSVSATFALLMAMLFRNNGSICVIGCMLISCIFIRRTEWKRLLTISIISFVLFIGIDHWLTTTLDATPSPKIEMFSVIVQQFGRIYDSIEPGSDTATEDIVTRYFNIQKGTYDPHLADPVKFSFREPEYENMPEFFRDSLRLFVKYKLISIDSLLYTTEGLWYLFDVSNSNIYEGEGPRQGYLLTDIKRGYDLESHSKLPALEAIYERLFTDNEYQKIPILSVMFSPALYIYIMLLSLIIVLTTKNRMYSICFPFFIFLLFTDILAPCVVIRYVYPFVLASPLFCWICLDSVKKENL